MNMQGSNKCISLRCNASISVRILYSKDKTLFKTTIDTPLAVYLLPSVGIDIAAFASPDTRKSQFDVIVLI